MARRSAPNQQAIKALANKRIDFLCTDPGRANTTVTTKVFRAMLLISDGYVFYNGKQYDIKGKSLGAGVYRVTLKEVSSQ